MGNVLANFFSAEAGQNLPLLPPELSFLQDLYQ